MAIDRIAKLTSVDSFVKSVSRETSLFGSLVILRFQGDTGKIYQYVMNNQMIEIECSESDSKELEKHLEYMLSIDDRYHPDLKMLVFFDGEYTLI